MAKTQTTSENLEERMNKSIEDLIVACGEMKEAASRLKKNGPSAEAVARLHEAYSKARDCTESAAAEAARHLIPDEDAPDRSTGKPRKAQRNEHG